jgi:hypothetical protein
MHWHSRYGHSVHASNRACPTTPLTHTMPSLHQSQCAIPETARAKQQWPGTAGSIRLALCDWPRVSLSTRASGSIVCEWLCRARELSVESCFRGDDPPKVVIQLLHFLGLTSACITLRFWWNFATISRNLTRFSGAFRSISTKMSGGSFEVAHSLYLLDPRHLTVIYCITEWYTVQEWQK